MNNDNITVKCHEKQSFFDPTRWGLTKSAIDNLADRLQHFWLRFKTCFTTKTRDTSQYAFVYMRGLLTMDTKRNYANIARRVIDHQDDGQNIQQFMSDSPWSASQVFDQIQSEIKLHTQLNGGMLTLDESGDKRSGSQSAGTARQHIGRLGKVDMGQVGVALGYYQGGIWSMVASQLYLPEVWFDKNHEKLRKRWHIPAERTFDSKADLGIRMIRHAKANGLQFEVVGCDTIYGRDSEFRRALDTENIAYMADIPSNIHVYLTNPVLGIPPNTGKQGRPCSRMQVINGSQPVEVSSLAKEMTLTPVTIRHTERGMLVYECSVCRVWTISQSFVVAEEWLLVRREADGDFSFSLSNAPKDVSLAQLSYWRCERYFAERVFQDAKTEGGWDELVARKYRAWEHHTALDALTLWFIAETKLDWSYQYPRDPMLLKELGVSQLPALSMSNVREMLKAVLPLKQLSPEEATQLVVNHLVNRSNSTSCRLKAQDRMNHQSREP
jgi:SRSO17 transposase